MDDSDAVVGQTFTLSLIAPYPNNDSRLAGARLSGRVVNVVRAGQGRKAQLDFAINRITLRGGQSAWFSAKILSVDAQTKSNAGKVALTALGAIRWKPLVAGAAAFAAKVGIAAATLYSVAEPFHITTVVALGVTIELAFTAAIIAAGRKYLSRVRATLSGVLS